MSHTIATIRASNPMWVYERNFGLLNGLFPSLWSESQSTDSLTCSSVSGEVTVRVVERCRYTLSAILTEVYRDLLVPEIQMQVRIYNDARLVEAVSYQGATRLLPKFTNLSRDRFSSVDEKRHTNLLLHDWLVAIHKEQLVLASTTDCSAR